MSGFVVRALLACVIAVSPSATLAQRTAFADPFPHVAPPTIDTTRTFLDHRITDGSRFGAIVVSSMIGLGLGHHVMGFSNVGRTFFLTQGAGVGLMVVGLGLWNDAGGVAFFGGMALYVGSRVWEFADVVIRPTVHNARIDAAAEATNGQRGPQARLSPVFSGGRQGLALSVSF